MGKNKQKTVKIRKELCDRNHHYTMLNLEALRNAASMLSGDGMKLWLFFAMNQSDYELSLSSKYAEEAFCLSKRRYDKAVHELTELGYLIDTNTDPDGVENTWEFHELPIQSDLVEKGDKPLYQNDTSLSSIQDKACIYGDTTNNTYNTNNTEKQSQFIF